MDFVYSWVERTVELQDWKKFATIDFISEIEDSSEFDLDEYDWEQIHLLVMELYNEYKKELLERRIDYLVPNYFGTGYRIKLVKQELKLTEAIIDGNLNEFTRLKAEITYGIKNWNKFYFQLNEIQRNRYEDIRNFYIHHKDSFLSTELVSDIHDYYIKFLESEEVRDYKKNGRKNKFSQGQKTERPHQTLSFGFKEDKYKKFKKVCVDLTKEISLVNLDFTSVDDMIKVFTAKNLETIDEKIHIGCENTQFRYVLDKFRTHFFLKLTWKRIEDSAIFYTKRGTLLTASNISRSKIYSPKEYATIDEIFENIS